MVRQLIVTVLVTLLGAGFAMASDDGSEKLVKVSVAKAYIPQGFDNNDVTKIVVEGFFPNTCYKIGKNEVKVDAAKREIEVTQTAYVYQHMCLMMVVPYNLTVEVGVLKSFGDYKVMDSLSKMDLGGLPVTLSKNAGPDDFIYATISDAYVSYIETDERVVVLHGELPGNCWQLSDKKIFMDGKDVVTVLPAMQMTSDDVCNDTPVPFVTTVKLPELGRGRYLLNVRSLNGNSVNKLFDVN